MNKDNINRRAFLERLGSIGALTAAAGAFPWFQSCTPKATDETKGNVARLGIIGPGSRGLLHIRHLLDIDNAKIVALCDNYPANLEKAAVLVPGAKLYTDWRKLLEDKEVDGVIIATPLHLHHEMTIAALEAGKHVFCEKAMAYTQEQCLEMYRKHQQTGKVLIIGQQRMFDPKYLLAMKRIRSGEFGPVVNVRGYWFRNGDWRREVPADHPELERHINWRLYREYSRGLMTELACHQLQNGTWATGMLPEKVIGTGNLVYWKDGREVQDSVCCIYTFPNGVNMTFESVISNKHLGMGESILCKEATIDLPGNRIYREHATYKSGMHHLITDIEKGIFSSTAFAGTSWAADNNRDLHGEVILEDAVPGIEGDGSIELMQAFCNSVISGEQPKDVLEEGYYGSILCLMGDDAILQERTVKMEKDWII